MVTAIIMVTLFLKMLVDSGPGWIELLPALPEQWPTGRVEGVRCRGQIELRSLGWSADRVAVTLFSDVSCRVQIGVSGDTPRRSVDLSAGQETALEFSRHGLDLAGLHNPVWATADNLRDPAVVKTPEGYHLFYSRFSGSGRQWADPECWATARVFTRDFAQFTDDRDVSPKGFASPGDVVFWHGRYVLPYQSYPAVPTLLCFSESLDLAEWSAPQVFLAEAAELPWNTHRRVIDPAFVVDGDTLHCYFVGSTSQADASGRTLRANLLGHATTTDPELNDWQITTVDAPLIGISERAPDGVENITIFCTGDHWTMLYSEGLIDQHLALATSRDLTNWTLEGAIDIPRQDWYSRKLGAPFVWPEADRLLMVLMGEDTWGRTTFGVLTSADGRAWLPLPERSPAGIRGTADDTESENGV